MYATYFIPRENEAGFKTKLDKLAKRATKLGLVAITYVALKTLPLERTRYRTIMTEHHGPQQKAYKVTLEHVAYTVKGEAPTLAGWEFVGTIEHEHGVNILRTITDEAVPERFRTASPKHCDHCGLVRNRTDTFIVRHVETGEYKQVGRSCLKDFLGNKSPGEIAAYATALLDFLESMNSDREESEGCSGGSGGGIETFELAAFLAVTAAAIVEHGWTSRTKAKELFGVEATADTVLGHFFDLADPRLTAEQRKDRLIPGATTSANAQLAKEAIEWAKGLDATGNDYVYNLQAIVELGYVTSRTAGYAASIVSGYFRETERALRKDVLKADGTEHVGTVGKREELLLTLIAVFYTEGYYGTTAIHKFADPDGNAVTWFASNDEAVLLSEAYPDPCPESPYHYIPGEERKVTMAKGATYRVKATVKDHGEYKGQAQTTVTRLTVLPVAKKPKKSRKKKVSKKQLSLV